MHLDHIQGLGFFTPFYDSSMEIHLYGPAKSDRHLIMLLTKYLSPPLFPILLRELPCRLYLHAFTSKEINIGEFTVMAQTVCHPGPTLGYRISSADGSIAYLPDHELALENKKIPSDPTSIAGYELAEGVDILFHDTQYTLEEYQSHIGWGHSAISQTLEFAKLAKVKMLVTFHHDPSHNDYALDALLSTSTSTMKPDFNIQPGQEGKVFKLEEGKLTTTVNADVDLLFKLNMICEQMTTYVTTIQNNLVPFFEKDSEKRYANILPDIKKIDESCELLKYKLPSLLLTEEVTIQINNNDLNERLAHIRHHLRNLIATIQGYAEIVLQDLKQMNLTTVVTQMTAIVAVIQKSIDLIEEIRPHQLTYMQLPIQHAVAPVASRIESEDYLNYKKNISILIVDDIKENCLILKRYLNRFGCINCQMAQSGNQALEMIEKSKFELVLLDIDMPGMNGIEVLVHLNEYLIKQSLIVLVVSGYDTQEHIIECIKLGAEDFLTRPFNAELLRVRINACIEKKWFLNEEQLHRKQLEREKKRHIKLLKTMFPSHVVKELLATHAKTKDYKNVAILFVDVVNFNPSYQQESPADILKNLQQLLDYCEAIANQYHLQRIKTIGNSVFSVASILTESSSPVMDCINCALEIIKTNVQLDSQYKLRLGIDFGDVTGKIVSQRSYLFDIWGGAYDSAVQVQSFTEPTAIFLTDKAFEQVKNLYQGRSLEKLEMEGRTLMKIPE